MYGDDDDYDSEDILEPMIEEFSIKNDVQLVPIIPSPENQKKAKRSESLTKPPTAP